MTEFLRMTLLVELPADQARLLFAEVKGHAARDRTDGHRDTGIVMIPSEAIQEAVIIEQSGRSEAWTRTLRCGCSPWTGATCADHCQEQGCSGGHHTLLCINGAREDAAESAAQPELI